MSWMVIAFGVTLVAFQAWARFRESSVARWPTVEGVVVSASVVDLSDSEGPAFYPNVEYRFQVGGEDFVSQRWKFGSKPGFASRHDAEQFLMAYAIGATVPVHYNPNYPRQSVLITQSSTQPYRFAFWSGLGFMLTGAVLTLFGL